MPSQAFNIQCQMCLRVTGSFVQEVYADIDNGSEEPEGAKLTCRHGRSLICGDAFALPPAASAVRAGLYHQARRTIQGTAGRDLILLSLVCDLAMHRALEYNRQKCCPNDIHSHPGRHFLADRATSCDPGTRLSSREWGLKPFLPSTFCTPADAKAHVALPSADTVLARD